MNKAAHKYLETRINDAIRIQRGKNKVRTPDKSLDLREEDKLALLDSVGLVPSNGGAWQVWGKEYAALYKQEMDRYEGYNKKLDKLRVAALDQLYLSDDSSLAENLNKILEEIASIE